jgi:hypothetical protein
MIEEAKQNAMPNSVAELYAPAWGNSGSAEKAASQIGELSRSAASRPRYRAITGAVGQWTTVQSRRGHAEESASAAENSPARPNSERHVDS